ncbi:MAG: hypothetical protein U9N54_08815, partial [candidate division Zixibacteria bacterium]|nr:hypothetical protein [candidate division Zixibacteria bacterium]
SRSESGMTGKRKYKKDVSANKRDKSVNIVPPPHAFSTLTAFTGMTNQQPTNSFVELQFESRFIFHKTMEEI